MLELNSPQWTLKGPAGSLPVPTHDEITHKLAMLYEGECEGGGPLAAATKFGFSKQRYFQLRKVFQTHGALALQSQKTGPKGPYRRTDQVQQQIIRHRFLDPEASASVVAQKMRQVGQVISTRSVHRVIAQFGLQKKTLRPGAQSPKHPTGAKPAQRAGAAPGARRPRKSGAGGAAKPGR